MEQVSREHEAQIRRSRAAMIRKHIHVHGIAMGLQSQLAWLGVAEAEDTLAHALELPALETARAS